MKETRTGLSGQQSAVRSGAGVQTGCRSGRAPRKEKHPSDQRPVLHVDTDGWEGGGVGRGGRGGGVSVRQRQWRSGGGRGQCREEEG